MRSAYLSKKADQEMPETSGTIGLCLLCEEEVTENSRKQECRFHSGRLLDKAFRVDHMFKGVIMDVGITPDEAKKSAYEWTCCSASAIRPSNREAPLRTAGCRRAPRHITSMNAIIVLSDDWLHCSDELTQIGLATLGAPVKILPLSEFQGNLPSTTDCIAFVANSDDQKRAMEATEVVSRALPDLPLVIFSDPDRIDGWRLQASDSKSLTLEQLLTSMISAFRQSTAFGDSEKRRVFLSYSRRDAGLRSDWADELVKIDGGCWVDVNMLDHGVDWSNAILDGIAGADYFVLLLTANTPRSTYCWKELVEARRHNIPVIVVAYDESADQFLSTGSNAEREWRTIYACWHTTRQNRAMIVDASPGGAATIIIPATDKEKNDIYISDIKSYIVDFISGNNVAAIENPTATEIMIGDKTWHDLAPEISDFEVERAVARSKMPLFQRWWDRSWFEGLWLDFAHLYLPGRRNRED